MKNKKIYTQSVVWGIVAVALIAGAYFVPLAYQKYLFLLAGVCSLESFNWFTNPITILVSEYKETVCVQKPED